ncbi:unnamed protein product, partial [Brassica rapa]
GPKAHPQKPDDEVGEPVKKARHTDRSALFTRYASPLPRLNHLRRYAVGAIPAKKLRSSELGNRQASKRTRHRSSPHCLHAGEFHRSPRSPPTLNHFKP